MARLPWGYGVHTSRLRGKHRDQARSHRILQAFVPNLQNGSVGASLLAMLFAAGFCWAPLPVEVWRKPVGASSARELGGYGGKLASFCYKIAGNRCVIGRPAIQPTAPRCVHTVGPGKRGQGVATTKVDGVIALGGPIAPLPTRATAGRTAAAVAAVPASSADLRIFPRGWTPGTGRGALRGTGAVQRAACRPSAGHRAGGAGGGRS